jgi:hypothetical protein
MDASGRSQGRKANSHANAADGDDSSARTLQNCKKDGGPVEPFEA